MRKDLGFLLPSQHTVKLNSAPHKTTFTCSKRVAKRREKRNRYRLRRWENVKQTICHLSNFHKTCVKCKNVRTFGSGHWMKSLVAHHCFFWNFLHLSDFCPVIVERIVVVVVFFVNINDLNHNWTGLIQTS